jgi:nucleotide-binding universal stress UspA family protein
MIGDIKRILVALDASPHSRAALEEAAALAARLNAELLGLFVQDLELVQLAQLPFAREVGLTSAESRALDPGSMDLALKAQAQTARTQFESIAQHHRLHFSFRVARGHVVNELLAASGEVDLLALGSAGHMEMAGRRIGSTTRRVAASAHCSVLIEQHTKRPGAAILLLYEDSPSADNALARAEQLAASRDAELVIVLTGAATAPGLRERLDRALHRGTRTRVFALDGDRHALQSLAAAQQCGLLLIAHDSPLLAREPELLGEMDIPILLAK